MSGNLSNQERTLLEALRRHPKVQTYRGFWVLIIKGADVQMLMSMCPGIDESLLVERMNALSSKQLVDFVTIGSNVAFRARDLAEVTKTHGLDQNERIVYNIVRGIGNKGIWIKDIKQKSNMHTQLVNTSIKSLEKKNLIKSIKSVKNPTKKLYILSELEPSTELTGGSWYTDQEFDLEFIEALSKQCFKYIFAKTFPSKDKLAIHPSYYESYPTVKDVLNFIKRTGITNVELSVEDVKQLLERLVYDGTVYKRMKSQFKNSYDDSEYKLPVAKSKSLKHLPDDDENVEVIGMIEDDGGFYNGVEFDMDDAWMYIATKETISANAFTEIPCGKCPVFGFCSDDGPVNPSSCTYLNKWLAF